MRYAALTSGTVTACCNLKDNSNVVHVFTCFGGRMGYMATRKGWLNILFLLKSRSGGFLSITCTKILRLMNTKSVLNPKTNTRGHGWLGQHLLGAWRCVGSCVDAELEGKLHDRRRGEERARLLCSLCFQSQNSAWHTVGLRKYLWSKWKYGHCFCQLGLGSPVSDRNLQITVG